MSQGPGLLAREAEGKGHQATASTGMADGTKPGGPTERDGDECDESSLQAMVAV